MKMLARALPDQTECDREPVHIPGSIQPHGMLLIVDPDTGGVVGYAGDIDRHFAIGWQGQSIDDLLQLDIVAAARASAHPQQMILGKISPGGDIFDVLGHRSGPYLVIELDPAHPCPRTAEELLDEVEGFTRQFENAPDTATLFTLAAQAYRRLTGFDRVMIYQFLEDGSGVVTAEDRNDVYRPFLHHHFPESDIPKQARALYLRNRVRVIPDATYASSPIRWLGSPPADPLDLSDVALRSVSPVHLLYLRNMGVVASASVSIIKDNRLWGLVACHNASPRQMPFATRVAASTMAASLSRQINMRDEADDARERLRLRAYEDSLFEKLHRDAAIEDILIEIVSDLQAMLLSQGFAVIADGKLIARSGATPDIAALYEIARLVLPEMREGVFTSHEFGRRAGLADTIIPIASGVAVMRLWPDQDFYLMWFRAEHRQIVEWAGNPHKPAGQAPSIPLSPRASFAAWSEAVRGCSRPWNANKQEAMHRLARILRDGQQRRHIDRLNRDLHQMLDQKVNLLKQQDYLMREINHRVQNSLQLVSTFLMMQARDTDNEEVVRHLNDAHSRIAAVALVHRRLYSDNHVGEVDLARYMEDLSGELFRAVGEEWQALHHYSYEPVLMSADRAVNLGLIFSELVTNANKYAYDGAPGPLSSSLKREGGHVRLIVADEGGGRTRQKTGFGSRMLAAIVSGLGGEMTEVDNQPGLRIIVTIPISFESGNQNQIK